MKKILHNGYAQSVLIVILITIFGAPIHKVVDPTNLVMFYLLGVVITALRLGRGPSILTAVLSVLALDIFFVPPQFQLGVQDAQYLLTFIGLLAVGLVISALTAQAREQTQAAQHREREAMASYHLSRDLASAADTEMIVQAVLEHISRAFDIQTAIFLPGDNEVHAYGVQFGEDAQVALLAAEILKGGKVGNAQSKLSPDGEITFLELRTTNGIKGVLALANRGVEPSHSLDEHRLLQGFASQTALALERVQLAEKAHQAEVVKIAENLQDALLNSISHDLRTPLASITGALSTLQQNADALDESMRLDLIETAWEEANRLNQLVGNLLDMTRLEAGAMRVKREVCDPSDVIGVALAEMGAKLADRPIEVKTPEELSLAPMDFVLIVQVLVNLLDNAVKYSLPGSPITLEVCWSEESMQITVADRGIGVPPHNVEHIFDKFFRGQHVDGVHGTGLGLSISKGIVEAHGGQIAVASREGGGSLFTISLPLHPSAKEDPVK